MPKTPNYPVPALEKGLDILEALSAAAVPQSLAELAVLLARSRNELFRMLNCLERRGYVARDPVSSKYSLSLKLYTLAHAHSMVDKLVRAARVPMQALTERFRESCHLSVLERGRLLVVAQQESPDRVRLSIEVGGSFDPERTASGRLLLAHLDEAERRAALEEAVVRAGRPARGGAAWERALAEIRQQGVSAAESETVEGVRDLAVLVGNPAAGVMAALAITRLHRRGERTEESVLLEGIRETAAVITRTLGLQGPPGRTGTED